MSILAGEFQSVPSLSAELLRTDCFTNSSCTMYAVISKKVRLRDGLLKYDFLSLSQSHSPYTAVVNFSNSGQMDFCGENVRGL